MTTNESKEPGRRVAVVTGAARGIGLAIGARLAAEGFSVALWDRDAGQLNEAEQSLRASGAHAMSVAVNITDRAQVDRALAQSTEALGAPTRWSTMPPFWGAAVLRSRPRWRNGSASST